jgi:hypothetical protein
VNCREIPRAWPFLQSLTAWDRKQIRDRRTSVKTPIEAGSSIHARSRRGCSSSQFGRRFRTRISNTKMNDYRTLGTCIERVLHACNKNTATRSISGGGKALLRSRFGLIGSDRNHRDRPACRILPVSYSLPSGSSSNCSAAAKVEVPPHNDFDRQVH